jgi:nucleoside-diphosphate-sugar epimerase
MTVLVTGSNGFTGRYLLPRLKKAGFNALGLTHGSTASEEITFCDLANFEKVKSLVQQLNPSYVVHLAAISFVAEQDEEAFYRTNLFGTQNLLKAIATLPVLPKKVLIASSATVYGLSEHDYLKESVCPAPVNHYGISKLAMECMVRTWFDLLPIVITRPFNYTGPGQNKRFLVPKIVDCFQRKEPMLELGNLNVSRDFLDVRDVVAIYLALLKSDIRSEIINICSGKGTELQEIINEMTEIAGYKIKIHSNPAFVRSNEIHHLTGDNSKLKKMLAFSPKFTLPQTLQDIYENPL